MWGLSQFTETICTIVWHLMLISSPLCFGDRTVNYQSPWRFLYIPCNSDCEDRLKRSLYLVNEISLCRKVMASRNTLNKGVCWNLLLWWVVDRDIGVWYLFDCGGPQW